MEFHIISMEKDKCLAGISKNRKTSIQLFTENMIKELFISIMEKHLKEIKIIARKTLG